MLERAFAQWWVQRVMPFRDVPPEKLDADREALRRQQEYNVNYQSFLHDAVLPSVQKLTQFLRDNKIVHRVATWGNQLAIRVHLAWRWGELVITQSQEDCVAFDHHIVTEGERRGDDSVQDHTHVYDLRDPLPPSVAGQEIQFFLSRLAQDLFEGEPEPEIPPGEKEGE